MGWWGETVSKDTAPSEFVLGKYKRDGIEIVASSFTGGEAYILLDIPNKIRSHYEGDDPEGRTLHMCIDLYRVQGKGSGDREILIKNMSEESGPCYYNCPKKILDILDKNLPPRNDYAAKWREECRRRIVAKSSLKDMSRGDIVHTSKPLFFSNSTSSLFVYEGKFPTGKGSRKQDIFYSLEGGFRCRLSKDNLLEATISKPFPLPFSKEYLDIRLIDACHNAASAIMEKCARIEGVSFRKDGSFEIETSFETETVRESLQMFENTEGDPVSPDGELNAGATCLFRSATRDMVSGVMLPDILFRLKIMKAGDLFPGLDGNIGGLGVFACSPDDKDNFVEIGRFALYGTEEILETLPSHCEHIVSYDDDVRPKLEKLFSSCLEIEISTSEIQR